MGYQTRIGWRLPNPAHDIAPEREGGGYAVLPQTFRFCLRRRELIRVALYGSMAPPWFGAIGEASWVALSNVELIRA